MESENIAMHSEALNLKSSQAACFNFLLPLRQDLKLATHVLRPYFPSMGYVTNIEFEFTCDENATTWLGEPDTGGRGQNRTSIDAAIFYNDNNGKLSASLVEWKYTERNFGRCSAYSNGSPEQRDVCRRLNEVEDKQAGEKCHLTSGKRHRDRHYWDHMREAGINLKAFDGIQGCPFQDPFYQLMRQFMLAAYLRTTGKYDFVAVVAMSFAGNTNLNHSSRQLRPLLQNRDDGIIEVWNSVLKDIPPLRHITVEELMASVDHLEGVDVEWRGYIKERYGV